MLNLEGLWTRYDDPEPLLAEIAELPDDAAPTARLQEIYAAPVKEELIGARIKQIRDAGVTTAASLSPQRTVQFAQTRARRRRRPVRHPGHRRVGRARVVAAASR